MSELPEWAEQVIGRNPNGWWRPIVCTNRRRHPVELLGVLFEDPALGLSWSGPGIAWQRVEPETAAELQASDALPADHEARYGRGSMRVTCPQGCTPRLNRQQWGDLCDATRTAEPHWLDVSVYG